VYNLLQVVNQEISASGYNQTDIANGTYCTKSTVSNYLRKRRSMPTEWVRAVADLIGSTRLKIIHAYECSCGFFKTPYLAGVDDHPVTVKAVGIRELAEALEALATLDIENKRCREDFNREEWAKYECAMEQICDLHPYIEKALESGQKYFGLDVPGMQKRLIRKYANRGYIKEKAPRKREAV